MNTLLEVKDVDQEFQTDFWQKKAQVLHSVSLSVPERAIFGFLGANGAGKTTLINLVVGFRKPTRGSVRVAGFDAHTREARAKIGFLPERPYFYDHLTGDEMLSYFGSLSGMTRARIIDRIPTVLKAVNMSHAGKTQLKKYSKGMLQRIGIAQALLHDPPFLVLDEPMSGLDPVGRMEMRDLILRLSSEGHTIFFSSHVIPDVEAICDRVGLIKKGRMVGSGPIRDFLMTGQTSTEILFSGKSAIDKLRGAREFQAFRETSDGAALTIAPGAPADPVLKSILEAGGSVRSVMPLRPSLESYFGAAEGTS